MYDPTVPALDPATVEAEDRLFDAVEPVLTEWMGARDNLCEELERRAGADWCPPGGVDRALEALARLEAAEGSARTELARLLAEFGHGGDFPEPALVDAALPVDVGSGRRGEGTTAHGQSPLLTDC
jgi:hypothetical protein